MTRDVDPHPDRPRRIWILTMPVTSLPKDPRLGKGVCQDSLSKFILLPNAKGFADGLFSGFQVSNVSHPKI